MENQILSNQIIDWSALTKDEQNETLARPAISDNTNLSAQVADILALVKDQGDQALFQLTEKFDGIALTTLKVTQAQVEKCIAS